MNLLTTINKPLIDEFQRIRHNTVALCDPLQIEDYGLQGMADTSPPKWHLTHTTWFFETFVLKVFSPDYSPSDPIYEHLFNSYYNGIGKPFSRPHRGLLSRPTVNEVFAYRRKVDELVLALLATNPPGSEVHHRIELGLHHEQQHQELLLTDIKYSFHLNPLLPVYRNIDPLMPGLIAPQTNWLEYPEALITVGASGKGFCFDNETPTHRHFLEPFAIANRPVTNGDYLKFIQDNGYARPELWLSDGWTAVTENNWQAPLYWQKKDGGDWWQYTLSGEQPVNFQEPVCHISYYEADAYARWAGARLPTEIEWEYTAQNKMVTGNLLGMDQLHPRCAHQAENGIYQLYGDVWEWTCSSYLPYPGYQPAAGAIGEYNGKFMGNQMVLRGGSCVSDAAHIRATYRNFFYPPDRWQFSGLRLARSLPHD